MLALFLNFIITPASAVFISFQNCLPRNVQNSAQLQIIPLHVDAVFDTTDPSHNLNLTVWGNVTGSLPELDLPSGTNTSYWNNPNMTDGKIVDVPDPEGVNVKTSFFRKVNALTYQPYQAAVADFCESLINATCPLGPVFPENASVPVPYYELPAISLSDYFYSSYAFTSLAATLRVSDGDDALTDIFCVSAIVTPDLGGTLVGVIKFVPLVILIFVGVATAFAGIYSPWGSTDIFRWTSNYGRDPDLLRLVTPGFGDCLQYIQFIVLTGSLTLDYPGFYQPVISQASWSVLMFNQSLVSHGNGTQSLVDGIYVTNATYGLENLSQLVGMSSVKDIWADMAVWLLAILAGVITLIQICFALRWVYRRWTMTLEEDLRAKDIPFSAGNVVRIVFNYLYLPIVALSMFQLVVASRSPAYTVALAVAMLLVLVGFAGWLFRVIARAKPRSFLFDDLSTVLTYGPLYNTYSDDAAAFAIIPLFLTLIRGVAIGAVQPSGIAQIVILAICEVVTVLTLHAFQPFHSPTSMNAYHTIFATVRLASVLLMLAFAPSLGVTEGPKGWIGYVILLLHAVVLILGFFLNSLQTMVEVAARMAGAGDNESGATRGGLTKVFGMRQLSRRLPRRDAGSRTSQHSRDAMLVGNRMRSQSTGSTGLLLNRQSVGLDSNFGGHVGPSSQTRTSGGEQVPFSYLPAATAAAGSRRNSRGPILRLSTVEAADPYYRPPRTKRPTIGATSPRLRSGGSWVSSDWAKRESQPQSPDEGPSISGRATPNPVHLGQSHVFDPNAPRADYTTREVDFYYGVRGPALNGERPGRRMATGPANPTNPISTAINSASGFFKSIFGGKTKEKGKGFEVVRSSRMPPGMAKATAGIETPPEGIPVATDTIRHGPIDSDDEDDAILAPDTPGTPDSPGAAELDGSNDQIINDAEVSPVSSEEEYRDDVGFERIPDEPPSLPGVEFGTESIELPRMSSRASRLTRKPSSKAPTIPKKNSKRAPRGPSLTASEINQIMQTEHRPPRSTLLYDPLVATQQRSHRSQDSARRLSNLSTVSYVPMGDRDINSDSPLGNMTLINRNDRPASMKSVQHHSPQTVVNPKVSMKFLGTAAEVVGEENGRSM